MPVKTKSVQGRRTLHFKSLDDFEADVKHVGKADRAGELKRVGNWTTGQMFGHLATFMEFSFNGYPPQLRPPWFIKAMIRMMKNKWLRSGFPAGVNIGKIEGGTLGTEVITTAAGEKRLLAAIDQLRASPPAHPSPAFGAMTHEQSIQLALRHGELHLSFFVPEAEGAKDHKEHKEPRKHSKH
jgi:hypothetical protein